MVCSFYCTWVSDLEGQWDMSSAEIWQGVRVYLCLRSQPCPRLLWLWGRARLPPPELFSHIDHQGSKRQQGLAVLRWREDLLLHHQPFWPAESWGAGSLPPRLVEQGRRLKSGTAPCAGARRECGRLQKSREVVPGRRNWFCVSVPAIHMWAGAVTRNLGAFILEKSAKWLSKIFRELKDCKSCELAYHKKVLLEG